MAPPTTGKADRRRPERMAVFSSCGAVGIRASVVAQTFLSAGSGDFPVPSAVRKTVLESTVNPQARKPALLAADSPNRCRSSQRALIVSRRAAAANLVGAGLSARGGANPSEVTGKWRKGVFIKFLIIDGAGSIRRFQFFHYPFSLRLRLLPVVTLFQIRAARVDSPRR